jgi:hypothetical protein
MLTGVTASAAVVAVAFPGPLRFERTYYPQGLAHLTLSNLRGEITVTAWKKKEVWIRATPSHAPIEDRVDGHNIEVAVRTRRPVSVVNFEVRVPPQTSVTLNNKLGKIKIKGLTGHIDVDAFEGNIYMTDVQSPSIEVKVIGGDIFFDGDFTGSGPYAFQSMKGDIDLTLPSTTPFQFAARALKEKINVGDFQLNQFNQKPKAIDGNHLKGGPKLVITAYDGSIILHKR